MALHPRKTLFLILAAIILVGAAVAYLHFFEGKIPQIQIKTDMSHATKETSFPLKVTDQGMGLRNVLVQSWQGDNLMTLLEKSFPANQYAWEGEFSLPKQGLHDGPMEIVIQATDKSLANWGQGNTAIFRQSLTFDATPPRISVISDAHNLNQGGAGLIVYALSEEVSHSGVVVDDTFFPGYRQESDEYFCLFAIPFDIDPVKHRPVLTATDFAGNTAQTTFYFHGNRRSFREDTLNISDAFLENVMPQFHNTFPEAESLLELYLLVNRDLRARNIAFLQSLAATTSPTPLWDDVFMRQPRSAPRAGFADHRTYVYNGEVIDHQVHMGIDLASTAFDAIVSANRGQVIFTGELGIYGQTVILDHGLGLHSLYAHLSQILVSEGEMIEKGHVLGRSGMTGLAAGDHLHFEILISGVSINPIEWWDEQWLNHNFWSKTGLVRQDDQP
ncbi:MAG TPA: M23 family metallopeptidase [Desulfonatronum sp.]|nr:M23 family metallopeptidase [Desulfonatronum sp.]